MQPAMHREESIGWLETAALGLLAAYCGVGCATFEPPSLSAVDVDASSPLSGLAHVPEETAIEFGAALTMDVIGDAEWEIDTSDPATIRDPDGNDVDRSFVETAQVGSGPMLVILAVESLQIDEGVGLRVTGARPLVVFASDDITVNGTIDANARLDQPGPNGGGPGEGPPNAPGSVGGSGNNGTGNTADRRDGGGGGGAFGSAGGTGGNGCDSSNNCIGGGPGGIANDDSGLSILSGGSGGGNGAASETSGCATVNPGGAGGGAVQLSSESVITVGSMGGIHTGGGGGMGGSNVDTPCAGGGGGGGSGGAIYLQAPRITMGGTLAANGGGGGGAGEDDGIEHFVPGADAAMNGDEVLGGGRPLDIGDLMPDEGIGGDGRVGAIAPRETGQDSVGNGGGGGGGLGPHRDRYGCWRFRWCGWNMHSAVHVTAPRMHVPRSRLCSGHGRRDEKLAIAVWRAAGARWWACPDAGDRAARYCPAPGRPRCR